VRTHVDLGRLDVVEEILAVRAETADSVTVQVVALAAPDHPDAQITAALELGADLVGGAPHLADDPHAETLRLLGLAEAAGAGVDLHTDEQLHPDVLSLVSLARVVIDRRFAPPVTASHCVSLGLLPPDRLKAVIDVLLEAGIGIVALPITNLYLQGRGLPTSPPRGLTAVRALLDAGVPVAAGGDNIRDPFNPMGRADPLEAASLLVTAGHLSTAEAYAAVSTGARRVLGLSPAGSTAGMAADLLAIRAATLAEAVGEAGPERTVVRAGRVIGSTRVIRTGFEEFC
jgi:cytosine deaminase